MSLWNLLRERNKNTLYFQLKTDANWKSHSHSMLNRPRNFHAFESLKARIYMICLAILLLSICFLIGDLGLPSRAILLFTMPHITILTAGAFILLIEAIVGFCLLIDSAIRPQTFSNRIRQLLEVLCCVFSFATMGYTGVFLASNGTSIEFWNTWTLPVLFVFSSLSCGFSLILLISFFSGDEISPRSHSLLQIAHFFSLVLEATTLFLFTKAAFDNQAASSGISVLLSEEIFPIATIGVLGFGIVIPMVSGAYIILSGRRRSVPLSDALCLMAGLLLRLCVIVCGVH